MAMAALLIVFDPTASVSNATIAANGAISAKKESKQPISVFFLCAIMELHSFMYIYKISGQRGTVSLIVTKFDEILNNKTPIINFGEIKSILLYSKKC